MLRNGQKTKCETCNWVFFCSSLQNHLPTEERIDTVAKKTPDLILSVKPSTMILVRSSMKTIWDLKLIWTILKL